LTGKIPKKPIMTNAATILTDTATSGKKLMITFAVPTIDLAKPTFTGLNLDPNLDLCLTLTRP